MSHVALQRLAVRMLYDAALVDAVYTDPRAALADEELTEAERQYLTTPDRRAWKVDPLRRSRSLHALLEEFPAAAALALAEGAGLSGLDAFFSSPEFHRGIQTRRSLAAMFSEWLGKCFGDPVAPVARLEGAIAAVRRAYGEVVPAGTLGLAPRLRALDLHAGTLALYQGVMTTLGRARTATGRGSGGVTACLLDPMFALGTTPALLPGREFLLVEASLDGGVSIESASQELVALLAAAAAPRPREAMLSVARQLGCAPGEDAEIVDGLADEGMLVRG